MTRIADDNARTTVLSDLLALADELLRAVPSGPRPWSARVEPAQPAGVATLRQRRSDKLAPRRAQRSHTLPALTLLQTQLMAASSRAALAQRAIDAMTEVSGARCGVFFYDAAIGGERFASPVSISGGASHGVTPGRLAAAKAALDRVLAHVDAVRVDDVESSLAPAERMQRKASSTGYQLGSYLAVLIRDPAGKKIASCFVVHDRHAAFGERDLETLVHVAGQVGAAVEVQRARQLHTAVPSARARGESDEYVRELGDSIPQIVWIALPQVGCVYINERWHEYTGMTAESALGRNWLECVHPDDAPGLADQLRALEHVGKLQIEYRLRRHDGTYRWFLVRGTALRKVDGSIAKIYGTCTDIEDVKHVQQTLLEREAELREAQQLALLGAWSLDFASQELSFSEETYRIFGRDVTLPAPSFEHMIACIDPAQREVFVSSIASAKQTGHDFEQEWLICREDGAQSWVRGRMRVRRDERGVVAGLLGTLLDITQTKQNARALEEAMRHKDEFLAMLGHELRNPLAAVRNAVELQRLLEIEDSHFVQTRNVIDRQSRHMTRLIDELLDVARIARGKVHLERRSVNVGALLTSLVEDSANMIEQRGLTLELDLGAVSDAWVDGDATRLTQVLQNLLDNAAKFSDRGGRITLLLDVDAAGGEALVRVRDNGIGMDRDMLARIFDPFRQADRSLDRARGGLGLGLALVRGLVELHGGSVSAFSAGIGHGTEVVLRLPLVTVHGEAVSTAARERHAPGLRIVVIEDNLDSADTLRDALQLAGYDVRVAYDGETGLALVREFGPDLVLCDIGLPGKTTGYDVARELRQQPPSHMPYLVAVTGYGRSGDREQALGSGFDRHLTKPVNLSQIHEIAADRVAARAIAS